MGDFPHEEHEHPFYGVDIYADREQEHIRQLFQKYKSQPANEELRKKIWDELQMEKYKGTITIPFKVTLRRDLTGKFPNFIEIMLDTKV